VTDDGPDDERLELAAVAVDGHAAEPLRPLIPVADRFVDVDFDGLSVGVAEYDEGPTGCTVVALDRAAAVALDLRGGVPAVHNGHSAVAEAFCFAGGSVLGLDAASGVATALYARHGSDAGRLPMVAGGVIYDFAPADRTGVHPDAALGAAALGAAAAGRVPVGQIGAARSATCGKFGVQGRAEPGGQGVACRRVGNTTDFVPVIVNALGVVVDRHGAVVRGNLDPETGVRTHIALEDMAHGHARQRARFSRQPADATTLTLVVTDARLASRDHAQLARQIHASLARAIHPFHCAGDGDALWLATTGTVAEPTLVPTAIGAAAADLAWDAVLNAVE
jgi:L-aminopeptidase/D-esterase-like protein